MDGDLATKIAGALAAIGAGWYGFMRIVKRDQRQDMVTTLHDQAIDQVITTLRDEVARLTKRLELVEEQNRRCEERNDALHLEILEMKKSLQAV